MESRKQKEKECGEREKRTGPAAAKPKLTRWGSQNYGRQQSGSLLDRSDDHPTRSPALHELLARARLMLGSTGACTTSRATLHVLYVTLFREF